MQPRIYRFVGTDARNVPRIYAEHTNRDVAETLALQETYSYVRRRPDTGPLSQWVVAQDTSQP